MSSGPILIAGGGLLAAAVDERLRAAGASVERLTTSDGAGADPASIGRASALVLAADDDAGNVDLALGARRLRGDLPLVVRVFDEGLASYLTGSVDQLTVSSMSQIAAPVFAQAALDAVTRARTASAGPRLARRPSSSGGRRRMPDRILLGAFAGLLAVVIPSTVYFSVALRLRPLDALYFVWTTVMTVGYGDISLREASDTAKLVGMGLMLAGAAFVATLFAFLTGWLVTRRLDVAHGRVRVRGRGHAVIAGAGNLGYRVAQLLATRGHRVVIIERDPDGRNVTALRAAGHHVIVADATAESVLELAGVDRAAVVLALTDADAVNLQIALLLRARAHPLPVVLRMISPELSGHITARGDGVALSPLAVAAQTFADAALTAARPR